MPYIGKSPSFGVRNRFVYVASSGATSVSGADANGATLTFTDGAYVDVYLNGVLLKPTTDYNTSTANTIAGLSALNTNDEVTVVVYDVFTVADMVSATSGGTFSGAVTANSTLDMNGTELILDADADTSITADTDDEIHIKIAGADDFKFKANTLEVQTGSNIDMNGTELILDADGDTSITSDTDDVIDFKFGGTDRIQFTSAGGIITTPSAGGNVIYNEGGVDSDFRIEGATSDHAFFVRGDDSNIGMGTSTPDRMGSANSRGVVTIASNSYAVFEMVNGDSDGDGNVSTINFVFDNNTAANNGQTVLLRGFTDGTQTGHRGGRFSIFTKNNNATGLNEHFRIDKAGNITATDTSIGSISDERLKTNMEDFTYSIDDFKKYKTKKYDWKHPEVHGGKSGQWGFSAQDVEKIDERFVDEYKVEDTAGIKDEDGNQIVHPDRQYLDADDIAKSSKLQQKDAMYISVIQQLIARIEALESK